MLLFGVACWVNRESWSLGFGNCCTSSGSRSLRIRGARRCWILEAEREVQFEGRSRRVIFRVGRARNRNLPTGQFQVLHDLLALEMGIDF